MKILLLQFLFVSSLLFSQEEKQVTFIVNTILPDDTSSVYISGNSKVLGNWNPDKVRLNCLNGVWKITLPFSPNEEIEFKFTLGSWSREATDTNHQVPSNYRFTVSDDTSIIFNIPRWKSDSTKSFSGQVTDTVKYHNNFQGTGIRSRDIVVWLPPQYEAEKDSSFPVLYAHDGQNLFDPSTSTFGIDWQLDETADSLIRDNKINPIIIVGIYNTPDRSREYSQRDTGKAYMKFIVNELKPFIDKNYRTKPGREYTATCGSSAGGLISFILAWEYPDVFSAAACLSPAFHIADINYIPEVINSSRKPLNIYIDNGGVGLEKLLQPGIDEMIEALLRKDYKYGVDILYVKDLSAEHTESAWANRIGIALQFFFGK